jgi:hypothetical protein
MATYFYDGQIRRYLLQVIRLLSNFVVRTQDGTLIRIPVSYADPDRQVANIINQNSENTVQSVPKIAVYITDLELDTSRLGDSSFVGKVHIRERAFDQETGEYQPYQGNSYTVERLMPTPFKLSLRVDIWSSSTDQKLQILEQILMLFNPSLEIQTTDNYIDWTSLTVVDLTQVTFSSRTVPVGTATEIDIATLSLSTPIYLSPPAKVKRLGVVTNIISNIFGRTSDPYGDYAAGLGVDPEGSSVEPYRFLFDISTTPAEYSINVDGNSVELIGFDPDYPSWQGIIEKFAGEYRAGLSRIYLKQPDGNFVVGYFSLNPLDNQLLSVQWDPDSYPSNDSLTSQYRTSGSTFDAVIDPQKTGPGSGLAAPTIGTRYLILENIGGGIRETFIAENRIQRINTDILHRTVNNHKVFVNGIEVGSGNLRIPDNLEFGNYYITLDEPAPAGSEISYELYVNEDGPDAWKNSDGSDFIAEENDIIEWNGEKWQVIFDADKNKDQLIYLSNMYSGTQYKWDGVNWSKSFEGIYKKGFWFIEL